jgi:hypothetical protein
MLAILEPNPLMAFTGPASAMPCGTLNICAIDEICIKLIFLQANSLFDCCSQCAQFQFKSHYNNDD